MSDELRAVPGNAWRAAISSPWAITAEGLELVLAVAGRENDVSVEALEAYRAKHHQTAERLGRRGSVAILTAVGPMFSKANLFTAISGATSYDVLRRDLQVALDDPEIAAIVLNLDSPGGTVTGANELADAILAARERKRVVAYVGGIAASAAYWIAASAAEIVIDATAIVGSIGVRAVVTDTSKADAERGRVEFVSSQSPGKRNDIVSDEGRARIQRQVDALADVFIKSVARARGVKPETVVSKFGGGDVLVGAAAVAAGAADRLGSFEAVIAELSRSRSTTSPSLPKRSTTMNVAALIPIADHEAAIVEARGAERARIAAILELPEATGREASARHIALHSDMTADVAKGVLKGLAQTGAVGFGMRSADAPGGLLVVDRETGETRLAQKGEVVATDPVMPKTGAEQKKAMWGHAVKEINGEPPMAPGRVAPLPPKAARS